MAAKKPAAKIPKLDEAEDEGLPEGVSERNQQILEKVVCIQREIDQLNERASEEILHVEKKYNQLRTPHFKKRSDLLSELPDFWPTAMTNSPQFADLLSEDDDTVIQYLENVTVEEYDDLRSGFTITMHFRVNPYFTNTTLSKEYTLEGIGETAVIGTKIDWKEGMDLTERPPPDEGDSKKRPHEEPISFFTWFGDTNPADDIAEIIKDDIWPNPLQCYFLLAHSSDVTNWHIWPDAPLFYYYYTNFEFGADGQGQLDVSLDDDLEFDEEEEGLEEDDSDPGDEVVLSDEEDEEEEGDV